MKNVFMIWRSLYSADPTSQNGMQRFDESFQREREGALNSASDLEEAFYHLYADGQGW